MDEKNLRYCAFCGQPLEKYKKKFCSHTCSGLFQVKKKMEVEKMQNEAVGLDNILDPSYTDKDFLEVPAEEECHKDILFSFTPNYSADISVGTATVYGTPKALADYQFEYFRQKNEIVTKSDERISLRIYMLTGDILGEAKDIAAFHIAYEKLLEKSTTNEKTDENLNNPTTETFEEAEEYRKSKEND